MQETRVSTALDEQEQTHISCERTRNQNDLLRPSSKNSGLEESVNSCGGRGVLLVERSQLGAAGMSRTFEWVSRMRSKKSKTFTTEKCIVQDTGSSCLYAQQNHC
jgi:hypothetical protein